jgi:hypothetical protein
MAAPSGLVLASTVCSILVLTLALWIPLRLIRRSNNEFLLRLVRFVPGLLLLLSVARTLVPAVLTKSYALPAPILAILDRSYGTTLALSLIGAAVLIIPAAVFWILEKRRSLATSAASFLTVAAVLFPIQAGYSLVEWRSTATDSGFQQQGMLVPVKPERQPLRLVWIVFDELDYELAFPLRPPDVQTPQLDRFRSESVFATQAHPTAHLTSMAFPSFFTGRVVTNFNPHSAANVELRFQDGKRGNWTEASELFAKLQTLGINIGLVGWHNPYCRFITGVLSQCTWESNPLASKPALWEFANERAGLQPLDALSRADASEFFHPGPDPVRQYVIFREKQIEQFKSTLDEGLKLSVDPKLGVVLIHSLVPHPPGFWDRHQNKFSTSPSSNYFDNLEAMDLALGKIRRKLEQANMWDSSAVLVHGDHHLRRWAWAVRPEMWTKEEDELTKKRTDPRVAFLLKMPGQRTRITLEDGFNTVLLHDFVLNYMQGKIDSPQAAASWFTANRSRYPVRVVKPMFH